MSSKKGDMGYKIIGKVISFADIPVLRSLENNRSLMMMNTINALIRWKNIEALLLVYYDVGKSTEGADSYPPLMLLKCLLLQKWFRIPSDPDLENQINNRLLLKKFLNLALDTRFLDHLTFSRFRGRLSKEAIIHVNNEALKGFKKMGLSINKGLTKLKETRKICTPSLLSVMKNMTKKISKKRYIVGQYVGLSHMYDGVYRARFTTILKNIWNTMCRQMAFNMLRGSKLLVNT